MLAGPTTPTSNIISTEIVSQSLPLPLWLGMEIGTSHSTVIKLAPLMASWSYQADLGFHITSGGSFFWLENGDPSLTPIHNLSKYVSSHFWPDLPQNFASSS